MKKALFLDRDGVLNQLVPPNFSRGPINIEELIINYEMKAVIESALVSGYICEVISNQPDISRGNLPIKEHLKIVTAISEAFPQISKQRYCIHSNADSCKCRKPRIGLLNASLAENNLDISSSFFVGDKWTDVLAAKTFGCKSILLINSWSWDATSQGSPPTDLKADFEVSVASDILSIILD